MKRLALAILLSAMSVPAWAASGTLTTSGSTCTATGVTCLIVPLSQDKGAAGLTLSGTWTGTITFEGSADGGTTWTAINALPLNSTTAVTTTTGNGTWQINAAGLTTLRMRASATMTGSAIATITPSFASARSNGGGGGGGGGVTNVSGTTNQIAVATGTTTPVVSLAAAVTGADYILGATSAAYSAAVVNPGLYGSANNAPASPKSLDDEFPGSSLNTSTRWTWVNQGSATATVANSYLSLAAPNTGSAGTGSWNYIYQTAPATPWTVTMVMSFNAPNINYTYGGLVLSDSTGKLVTFGPLYDTDFGNAVVAVDHYASPTSYTSTPFSVKSIAGVSAPVYLRIQDDGTNLNFSMSMQGQGYVLLYTESRTAELASGPTRVGLGENCQAGSGICDVETDWFRQTQ